MPLGHEAGWAGAGQVAQLQQVMQAIAVNNGHDEEAAGEPGSSPSLGSIRASQRSLQDQLAGLSL